MNRKVFVNTARDEIGRCTVRKVAVRLLPFLFILYVIAFLDRVNFGYAALGMNSALGISAEIFGLLSGIFFIGYLLFEVPSNLILQRIGARIWLTRIMIPWGIVVIVTAAATDIIHLAALRFILGIAEAGFFPGVILYITFWFRKKDLAQAVALFMTALAVSNIIGAPVSTYILDNIHWLGIESWRWLFIIEGLPAIVLGILTWFYLTDRPEDADWLEPQEKAWLKEELDLEREEQRNVCQGTGMWAAIADWRIWYLSLIYCTVTIGLYGLGFWMPQIIRTLNPDFSNFEIGLVMMIPFIAAGIAMIAWCRHSDATRERRWHAALPPLAGGLGLAGAGLVSNPVAAYLFLILATIGIYCTFGPFWTLPAVFLVGTGAATGIALINSIGNAGGFIGPALVGFLVQITGSMNAGLIAIGICLFLGRILAASTRPEEKTS